MLPLWYSFNFGKMFTLVQFNKNAIVCWVEFQTSFFIQTVSCYYADVQADGIRISSGPETGKISSYNNAAPYFMKDIIKVWHLRLVEPPSSNIYNPLAAYLNSLFICCLRSRKKDLNQWENTLHWPIFIQEVWLQ